MKIRIIYKRKTQKKVEQTYQQRKIRDNYHNQENHRKN